MRRPARRTRPRPRPADRPRRKGRPPGSFRHTRWPAPSQSAAALSGAVTTADPLLTRVALGLSNDGNQFGMLLQVFTDGTVIDSEGVHRLSASELRPLVEAIQNSELRQFEATAARPPTTSLNTFMSLSSSADGTPSGPLVLVRRQCPRLRQRNPLPAHRPGKPPGQAQPPASRNCGHRRPRLPAGVRPVPAATSPQPATRSTSITKPVNGPATAPPLPDPSAAPDPGSSTGRVITLTPITPR